jgi:hypothetical protein
VGAERCFTRADGRKRKGLASMAGLLPRLFPDWLCLHPYQRSCSADRVTQGTEMPALQQKLSPSRKAGQRPIHKDKTCFCRFQPKHYLRKIRHCQQAIVSISASSCCNLSSSALFLSHSTSIVCPFSVSVILLYPSLPNLRDLLAFPPCLALPRKLTIEYGGIPP